MRHPGGRERQRADQLERQLDQLLDELVPTYAYLARLQHDQARDALAHQMSPAGRVRWVIQFLVGSDIAGAARVAAELEPIADEVEKRATRGKMYLL